MTQEHPLNEKAFLSMTPWRNAWIFELGGKLGDEGYYKEPRIFIW